MHVEMWINEYGDVAIFINDEYVLYDKCDKSGVEALSLKKDHPEKTMEEIKQMYRDNGFELCKKSI